MIPPETLAAALRVAEHRAMSAMLAQIAAQPSLTTFATFTTFTPAPEPQPPRTADDSMLRQARPADTGH